MNAIITHECEEEELRYCCDSCDYSMSMEEFDRGKGRIMFNDINEGKDLRCGVCDDRVSDPQGMFPNDEDEKPNLTSLVV